MSDETDVQVKDASPNPPEILPLSKSVNLAAGEKEPELNLRDGGIEKIREDQSEAGSLMRSLIQREETPKEFVQARAETELLNTAIEEHNTVEKTDIKEDDSKPLNISARNTVETSDGDNDSAISSSSRSSLSRRAIRASSQPYEPSEPSDTDPVPANPRKRRCSASSPNNHRKQRVYRSDDCPPSQKRASSLQAGTGRRRTLSMQGSISAKPTGRRPGRPPGSGAKKKRESMPPVRDAKTIRAPRESDASSETASNGQVESNATLRGNPRSTSTPGRPSGRELKRHVNKYGFTRLAEACEDGNLEQVKEWLAKDREQLEIPEFAENKPLQIAALNGTAEVVAYLIEQGCQIDCANVDLDTPLIDAAENGHLDVVELLLEAGVNPLRQNRKGQQALDVVKEDAKDADGIRDALKEAMRKWNSANARQESETLDEVKHHAVGTSKALHFMARTYENLQRLVKVNDRDGVREFLSSHVPVDNNIIADAAKTGDQYLVNMLLADMTEQKAHQKAEKPLLAVLGTSQFEMVKLLTSLDQFDPLFRDKAGKSWCEIAETLNGPHVKQEMELLRRLHDKHVNGTPPGDSPSPRTKKDGSSPTLAGREVARRRSGRRLMSRKDIQAQDAEHLELEATASASEHEAEERKPAKTVIFPTPPPTNGAQASEGTEVPSTARQAMPENRAEFDAQRTQEPLDNAAPISPKTKVQNPAKEENGLSAKEADQANGERAPSVIFNVTQQDPWAQRWQDIASSLPTAFRTAFDTVPATKGAFKAAISSCLPLRIIREEPSTFWVLNIQAAPLLGARGWELFLTPVNHGPNPAGLLSRSWPIINTFSASERTRINHAIESLVSSEQEPPESEHMSSFDRMLARANNMRNAKDRCTKVPLFCVRLQDIAPLFDNDADVLITAQLPSPLPPACPKDYCGSGRKIFVNYTELLSGVNCGTNGNYS
ncbi:hypothetical protein K470DRAFT_257751 [Piedraia hortae CBS 480.64]|uniref:Uncharacterized protein n=1 Tax=Piedraia hortae CBS 480.64 TaxID=1314780 RepID=A0A6A7C026_9PEZI|nr:hypothetical protein K470DRAFT_257751 [Piedraia hortae CBS 480.64]